MHAPRRATHQAPKTMQLSVPPVAQGRGFPATLTVSPPVTKINDATAIDLWTIACVKKGAPKQGVVVIPCSLVRVITGNSDDETTIEKRDDAITAVKGAIESAGEKFVVVAVINADESWVTCCFNAERNVMRAANPIGSGETNAIEAFATVLTKVGVIENINDPQSKGWDCEKNEGGTIEDAAVLACAFIKEVLKHGDVPHLEGVKNGRDEVLREANAVLGGKPPGPPLPEIKRARADAVASTSASASGAATSSSASAPADLATCYNMLDKLSIRTATLGVQARALLFREQGTKLTFDSVAKVEDLLPDDDKRGWLETSDIDAWLLFLSRFFADDVKRHSYQLRPRVVVLPCRLALPGQVLPQTIPALSTQLQAAEWVVEVQNIQDLHWVFVAFHVSTKKLYVADSMREFSATRLDDVAQQMRNHCSLLNWNGMDKISEKVQLTCAQQQNGKDCGVFASFFAQIFINRTADIAAPGLFAIAKTGAELRATMARILSAQLVELHEASGAAAGAV